MKKIRIDEWLVAHDYYDDIDTAKRAIMAGLIYDDNIRIDTAGEKINPITAKIRVKDKRKKYVSRGGFKLEKAIEHFNLNLDNVIHLDIGSSTGGFTDCALQNGAKHVYALDVGTNQLDYRLRVDERVTVMEQTNFRYVTKQDFNPLPNFISIDVSFISLAVILHKLVEIIEHDTTIIALIKPQFEARYEYVDKGIVHDKNEHIYVINEMLRLCESLQIKVSDVTFSPITGQKGNIEYLLHGIYLNNLDAQNEYNHLSIWHKNRTEMLVEEAFNMLNH
ncbi:TlyA family RNA methyltransferase [Macrococcoides caseolyticum]|uniref:TlyA family RNA methyltransferase n=1 Tax=Macrococcoides caseolyticum TaxID=69966 RepID=UPI001F22E40E|nr:TlyA family RNA methyltransferase [Macrococcus caseolyticus]MCE4956084.1 TlyA family RNA methyltransferase [Macrococcus caseolyticus]